MQHFGGVFNKLDVHLVDRRFAVVLHRMTTQCKRVPWEPFRNDELKAVRSRWTNGKACGPDSISHEALKILELSTTGEISSCIFFPTCSTRPRSPGASSRGSLPY